MSQGWRGLDWIPGVLTGTATVAIVVMHQQPVMALTFDQVRQIARPVTVMISDQSGGGSGVIIAKQGNTYTVLTNRHVVEGGAAYRVQTFDQAVHSQARVIKIFQDVDLAVVQFETSKVYSVATLGDSSLSSAGDTVFSFGYPGIYNSATKGIEQKYYDAEGIVLALDAKQDQGYVIKHRADTPRGMSGGPSFDAKGRLVAINGRHGAEFVASETVPTIDKRGEFIQTGRVAVQIYNGEWFSIPVNTALAQLSRAGINIADLKIDKTPPPNNRERIANPKNAGDFYLRATVLNQRGEVQSAIKDYTQAIKLDQNFIEAYSSRGFAFLKLAWLKQGDPKKAIDDFNEVIRRPSGDLRVYALINRAIARAELGDRQGEIEDYTMAIQIQPGSAIAYYNRGVTRRESGDRQGAIEDYTQAIKIDPKHADAYNNRGVLRSDLGDRQGAIEDYTQAVRIDPKDAGAYANRGNARYALGDSQGAIDDFNQAIRIFSKYSGAYNTKYSGVYNNRGLARAALGDGKGAIEDYTEAIRLDPKSALAYYNRGNSHASLGDRQIAIEDFTQAIRLNPAYSSAYNSRGIARADLSDRQGAIEDYTQAIRFDPQNAAAYNNRGVARSALKDRQGAIEDYTKAIEIDPKYAAPYGNRSSARLALGDKKGAIEDLTQAIRLDPQDAVSYSNRGVVRSELGDRQGAIEDLTQAIRLRPNYPTAYYSRGKVRAALGDKQGALEDYQKAASLYLEQNDTDAHKFILQEIQKL
jgi:tetratricopeptide (TPR) repeat protein